MLILLRHGRTAINASAKVQGDTDAPLDEVGIDQARLAGEYIRSRWDVQTVITSSLIRSRDTAAHAGFGPDQCRVDDRWREISFGAYEERKVADVIGDLAGKWERDIHFAPEGGESLAALHDRVAAACADVIEEAETRNVVVVSHATPIKSAVIWATGGTASMINNLWVDPATISVLDRTFGAVVLREFNRQLT